MSAVSVTWARTVGVLRNQCSSAVATAGFLAAAGASFCLDLEASEGGALALPAIWTLGVSRVLPAFAALLAMDVWSDERRSGRVDLLLTAPVGEWDLVLGKFLGVWTWTLAMAVAFLAVSLAAVRVYAPSALDGVGVASFLAGFAALALQGALWSAVSLAASALFSSAASAACVSLGLLVALPRGIWAAMLAWAPQGRTAFGDMPFDAHAVDIASGVVSSGVAVSYLALTAAVLFLTTLRVTAFRFVGRGARALRATAALAALMTVAAAALAVSLALRTDARLDLSAPGKGSGFSARTRSILAESRGEVSVTSFLSRGDPSFRSVAHLMRSLAAESESIGGVRLPLRFVDPHWDLGAAQRLVRLGVPEGSLVFQRGRRVATVDLAAGFGERECASAILRLSAPPQRRNVYWTRGHGELAFDAYGAWGLSDIARELSRDGYCNFAIDLGSDAPIPGDCALIVVAGAKDDFSRVETGRLDAYLRQGGRLLALVSGAGSGGAASLLPGWGLRFAPASFAGTGARTLSGSDVIVSEFADHAVTAPLAGSQVVLDRPVAISPSAAAETGGGADRIAFVPLASAAGQCVAAAVERGAGAGADIAVRPTRIVAVGDASFVANGQLASRANANRDFFLNCVAYLSGTDAFPASGAETWRFGSGMDRALRMRFALCIAAAVPAAVLVMLLLSVAWRRRRG